MDIEFFQWIHGLLTATVVIVVFSLFAFILLHNWRNGTARALCVLLLGVVVVYGGDVLVARAARPETIQFLLRIQWLGIALVPAAYLHLTGALSWSRQHAATRQRYRWYVRASYLGSVVFFTLALYTDQIVQGGIPDNIVNQVQAGPLFGVYVVWLLLSMLLLLRAIMEARQRALTPGQRRRLIYLEVTFMSPGLGVFPYLTVADYAALPEWLLLLLSSLVNLSVMGMLTVMTYSVSFQGIALPDRLIKYDFARWGLYGPLVGVTIILCLQIVPWLERILGLPADTLITFVVMLMTVLMPIIISRVRPYVEALVYKEDHAEIDYLRSLPRSTFTRADLRQLLENTLIAVCGALGVETGFIAIPGPEAGSYNLRVACGARQRISAFLESHPLTSVMPGVENAPPHSQRLFSTHDDGWTGDGFRLLPLHSPDGLFLGVLGIEAAETTTSQNGEVPQEALHLMNALTHQIELALTTVDMQDRLFNTLRGMTPDMQSLQQLTSQLEQANNPASLPPDEPDVSTEPQFPQLVKDALTHYWGGPKLSDSPLLSLRTVRRTLREHGGSPTRALQGVLRQAINNLRPDEQLDPTAQEWTLYNILEMRFLQGKRTRDVANRLSMSESDFYRKQRVAVEEVARQLALMENGEKEQNGETVRAVGQG